MIRNQAFLAARACSLKRRVRGDCLGEVVNGARVRARGNRSCQSGWTRPGGAAFATMRTSEVGWFWLWLLQPAKRARGVGIRDAAKRRASGEKFLYLPSKGMPPEPRRPKRAMRIAPLPIAGFRQRELRWAPRGTPHPTMMRWSGKRALTAAPSEVRGRPKRLITRALGRELEPAR